MRFIYTAQALLGFFVGEFLTIGHFKVAINSEINILHIRMIYCYLVISIKREKERQRQREGQGGVVGIDIGHSKKQYMRYFNDSDFLCIIIQDTSTIVISDA